MPPRAHRAGPAESPISVSSETPTPDRPPISLPPRRSSSRLRDLEVQDGPSGSRSPRPSASPERPSIVGGSNRAGRAQEGHRGARSVGILTGARERPRPTTIATRPIGLAIPTASTAIAGPSRARAQAAQEDPTVTVSEEIESATPAAGLHWPDEFLVEPTQAPAAGSSRAPIVWDTNEGDEVDTELQPRARPRTSIIDLTGDDDDEVEITGEAIPPRRPGGRRRSPNSGPLWSELRRLDRVVDQRGAATRAILDDPELPPANELRARGVYPPPPAPRPRATAFIPRPLDVPNPVRRRDDVFHFHHEDDDAVIPEQDWLVDDFEPPAPEPRPRIGFGGAVYRGGGRHIQYNAPPAPRAPPAPGRAGNRGARRVEGYIEPQVAMQREYEARLANARAAMGERNAATIAGLQEGLLQRGLMERLRGARGQWNMAGGIGAGMAEMIGRLAGGIDGRLPHGFQGLELPPGLMGLEGHIAQGDPQQIITQVARPATRRVPDGYTVDFDINDNETIEIDQTFTEAEISKSYIACINCFQPLYLSSGQKSPSEKVWALRCGHLIDQECLELVSAPQVSEDRDNINRPPPAGLSVLAEDEGVTAKGRRAKRPRGSKSKKTAAKPVEYMWYCPAKGCGKRHLSVLKDAEWKQDELEGAVQAYA